MNDQPLTVIEHIVKEYPTDMHKVTIFNRPLIVPKPLPGRKRPRNPQEPSQIAFEKSLQRTRTTIFDYALSNNFDLFATFTFNPKKVDRFSFESTANIMKYWLNRQKKHSPDFAYVIVPEHHKNKAIHFHALLQNYNPELTKTNIIQNGKRVYNIPGFTSGFTVVKKLDQNRLSAAAYLTKYITKDMISSFNKRRYWASKNLLKPIKFYDSLEQLELAPYITPENLTYESDEYHLSIYQFTKYDHIHNILGLSKQVNHVIRKEPPPEPTTKQYKLPLTIQKPQPTSIH